MRKIIVLLALLITAALLFGCYGPAQTNTNNNTPSPGTQINFVSIKNFAFNPSNAIVTVGTTVTWTNNDSTAHTVTADDASFDSGNLNPGQSYTHTFTAAGTISYHCKIHPMMKAFVTVQ